MLPEDFGVGDGDDNYDEDDGAANGVSYDDKETV